MTTLKLATQPVQVGKLAQRTRVIRVRNVLTEQEDEIEVPSECTVSEIREQYLEYNWHAKRRASLC